MAQNNGQPKKMGRPKLIDAKAESQILAILRIGGSLNDAADAIGINRSTLNRHKAESASFAKGVDRAIAKGKLRLVQKVGKAQPWQAAAWMLERKWGSEFGKREHHEHSGPDGGPIETETTVKAFDHDRFSGLYNRLLGRAGVSGSGGRTASPDGN